jgi:Uma2 family endonuclease
MSAKAAPKQRPATYADVEALPRHKLGEIIGDELFVSPRPGGLHAFATTRLVGAIDGPFQMGQGGPGGWLILFEPELHFDAQVLVPDVAAWRTERAPSADNTFFTDAPDWICETLSPSTAAIDRTRKLDVYAQQKVSFVWLIDPAARTLEVLRRDGTRWIVAAKHGGDEKVRAAPFDAFELDLSRLWARRS